MALETYMSIDEETKIVTFDKERAKEEGHAASIIALTDEMMTYQNLMMPPLVQFGKWRAFQTKRMEPRV